MNNMAMEIEKICAFSGERVIFRSDIDALVDPVPDAVTYKLTDALARGQYNKSADILSQLFQMREPPHKIMFSISMKMRQLLAARICFENRRSIDELIKMCGIRYSFQASGLMDCAKRVSLQWCQNAVIQCCDTAVKMNSGNDYEGALTQLLINLAAGNSGMVQSGLWQR